MRAALRIGAVAAAAAAALIMTALQQPTAAPARTRPTSPVELTYWTWAPNMDKVVDIWNDGHPEHPGHRQQAGRRRRPASPSSSPRSRPATAARPGPGRVPDAADARRHRRARRHQRHDVQRRQGRVRRRRLETRSRSARDAVYAIPQDTGPMMLYYRDDLFKQLGLTVPKTWDEFAAGRRARCSRRTREVPRHVLRQRPRLVRRPRPAGRRQVVGDQRRHLEGRHRRRPHQEGRRLLGRPRRGGRHRQQADVHPRVEQGAQRRHADRLARRGLGAGRAVRQRRRHQGQVGDRAAAAVDRRRELDRQLGRLVHRGHRESKHVEAAAQFADLAEHRPRGVHGAGQGGRHLPGRDGRPGRQPPSPRRRTFFSNQPDFYDVGRRGSRRPRAGFTSARTSTSPTAPTRTRSARPPRRRRHVPRRPRPRCRQTTVDDMKKSAASPSRVGPPVE